jgi:NAD(P)-dependent dehydrogenase (short-subunit alcohol dehydrogenase family)
VLDVRLTATANPRSIAIARRFAGLGCNLVLADLNGEGAEARAADPRAETLIVGRHQEGTVSNEYVFRPTKAGWRLAVRDIVIG